MKAYMITIIGSLIMSALAGIVAPDKWRSYVRIITGFVVISCIISPVLAMTRTDFFKGFDTEAWDLQKGEDMQKDIVKKELKARIDKDIEERLEKEFGLSVKADSNIAVREDGAVEGVRGIRVRGDKLSDLAIKRLCEVYGIEAGDIRQ